MWPGLKKSLKKLCVAVTFISPPHLHIHFSYTLKRGEKMSDYCGKIIAMPCN